MNLAKELLFGIFRKCSRALKFLISTIFLSIFPPQKNRCLIVTTNPFEENAAVQALRLNQNIDLSVTLISPNPNQAKQTVTVCAKVLNYKLEKDTIFFKKFGFWTNLYFYVTSQNTYATHVVLPGYDFSKKRNHTLITHGSGDKKEICFKSPLTTLMSVTPKYYSQQLSEYKFPRNSKVIFDQPRLDIFNSINEDAILKIKTRYRIKHDQKIVVWAPTYRMTNKKRLNQRSVGLNFDSPEIIKTVNSIIQLFKDNGYFFIIKIHVADLSNFENFAAMKLSSKQLIENDISTYQLFGIADILITDYSSIKYERLLYNLKVLHWRPDFKEFSSSYRGLREGANFEVGLENDLFLQKFFEF